MHVRGMDSSFYKFERRRFTRPARGRRADQSTSQQRRTARTADTPDGATPPTNARFAVPRGRRAGLPAGPAGLRT